jgi:hypothetical protein
LSALAGICNLRARRNASTALIAELFMTKLRHRSAQSRTLRVEQLEGRSCLAAMTASLSSQGSLQIQGTTANDNISLSVISGQVSISGVATKFAATQVKSIVAYTGGGNDAVNFAALTTAWKVPVAVVNSSGVDQIITPSHSSLSLAVGTFIQSSTGTQTLIQSGTSTQTVTQPTTTTQTVAPKPPDWFDSNIRDAALRALLKSDYADSKLSRAEMLAVFAQVKKDGVVSATEFSDLTATANNSSLYASVEYVGVLTKDVVLGNVANAKYQGTTLGNLKAGSSAAQLDKLVGKWFLGADHPVANYGGTTYAYASAKGTLFGPGGPKYFDVVQGAVGDCYLVGTLGELALKSQAAISSMFIVNGDGTYTVRFFNKGKADYVTVDSQLPVDRYGRLAFANMGAYAGSTSNVLWVALAEKAYVQLNEAAWLRLGMTGNGINSYQAIAGGWFSAVSMQVANRASTMAMVSSSTFDQFATAFSSGKFVGFASKSAPSTSQIVGNHQYVAVGFNSSMQTVTLFNPWGVSNGSSYAGLVTLRWSDLAASFSYWDRA